MSPFRSARRFTLLARGLWLAAWLLVAAVAWRLQGLSRAQAFDAPMPHVEDRRQYHFRNLTYTQTERLLQGWLRQAYDAATPREQGLALARAAILQRERGLDAAAQAAAQEALKRSRNDAEVRAILSRRLRPEEIRPTR